MAATQALYLKGSTLWRKNSATLIFERVAQMRLVPVPTATQEYADSTNHDSEGAFEENEPTIKRGDESGANRSPGRNPMIICLARAKESRFMTGANCSTKSSLLRA